MSVVITLTNFEFDSAPTFDQTVKVSWRRASDPDVAGSYTNAPDATVDGDGNITAPTPYQITVPRTTIVVKAVNSCSEDDFQKTFVICSTISISSTSLIPQCSSGYTLSADGTYCYKILTEEPVYVGGEDPVEVCHVTNSNYSQYGTFFYKLNGYNTNGTYTLAPVQKVNSNFGGTDTSTVWGNPSSNTTDGRMNKTALWNCADTEYSDTPIGFGFTINAPASKVYYVGFGSDNRAKITVNNSILVDQDDVAIATQTCGGPTHIECTFKLWHVYPIKLNKGVNVINVSAENDSSSVGAFGCEIYNATQAQLAACTTASGTNGDTSLATTNLHRYILFSTKDVADNTVSDLGNYECTDPTYTLINTGGVYTCQKILTETPH